MFIDKELEAHRIAEEQNRRQVIPKHTKEALELYVHSGIKPGGFLQAVLRNDLFGAYGRADALNIQNMFAIISYIYNYVPSAAHGSEEQIETWVNYVQQRNTEV